jgi:hypothetical protein
MTGGRSDVVSSFTVIKGALVKETYAAFQGWDLGASTNDNLKRLKQTNYVGASSANWLRDLAKVIHRRFDPEGRDRPLVELAQRGCELRVFAPMLLWHMTRDEFLVRSFLVDWLFPLYMEGTFRLTTGDVEPFLDALAIDGRVEAPWSDGTKKRTASALLKMGVDFGLLKGTVRREFASYQLPETAFLYLLHAIHEHEHNARRVIESPEWRMYLMTPDDVEQELLRLHQYRRLEYEVAGTLSQLKLPCRSPAEYSREMAA